LPPPPIIGPQNPGTEPAQPQPKPQGEPTGTPYPGYPGLTGKPGPTTGPTPPPAQPPRNETFRPVSTFHVVFREGKANLSSESMNALASAASQVIQHDRPSKIRLETLGPREKDEPLWQRRLQAVKDELVRMKVPSSRIEHDGTGPYVITIRANKPPATNSGKRAGLDLSLDAIPDPLSGEF
jgi:outer membrane protein OmpA-like peptidoglycan-associated protein